MTIRIARKELTEMMRDGRFRVLAALVLMMCAASFAAGWKQYVDGTRQRDLAQEATRNQWLAQPAKNPHSAAHYGVYAFKPKTRLSLVDTGVDPYVGVASWLEAHKQNEFRYRPAQDRLGIQRFGELTAADSLLVVLPLFIVLVCFAAFAGEREQGTLRQLLSLGVPRGRLVAGKALGVVAALGVIVVPATLFGVAGLALTSEFGGLRNDVPRAGLLSLMYLVYFAIFVAVSLGVSAAARSSHTALVVLLSFWFANSLVVGRAASDVVGWLHPTPSAVEFQRAVQADLNDVVELERRLEHRRHELMRQYNVSSVDAAPVSFRGISLQESENHGNEVFDRHYERLFDIYASQNRAYQFAGVVAPMPAIRSLSMALAGTDLSHHREFVRAAEQYRRHIQRVMNDDIFRNARADVTYLAGPELWSRVPAFDYTMPGVSWVVSEYVTSLLLLLAWLAASIWFAVGAGLRLSVD